VSRNGQLVYRYVTLPLCSADLYRIHYHYDLPWLPLEQDMGAALYDDGKYGIPSRQHDDSPKEYRTVSAGKGRDFARKRSKASALWTLTDHSHVPLCFPCTLLQVVKYWVNE
jgi:hypothetical protein